MKPMGVAESVAESDPGIQATGSPISLPSADELFHLPGAICPPVVRLVALRLPILKDPCGYIGVVPLRFRLSIKT